MKYKIYKLVHNGLVVYVGKTKRKLKERKSTGYKENSAVQSIYKECDMVLIEETNDVSRERYWIEQYNDTIFNIRRGNTGMNREEYMKEWREDNKEYQKEYREANREYYKQYHREYQREYMKEYRKKKKIIGQG
jgi:hypothetical protein